MRTKIFPMVVNPHSKAVQRWNKFFVIACLVAIFVDPLFFLLFSVDPDHYCITFNMNFAKVVTTMRSITDFIYFLHVLLQFMLATCIPSSTLGVKEQENDPKEAARNYPQTYFILDIFAMLPMPQIIILWLVMHRSQDTEASANVIKNILRVTVLLQYVPRCFRFLPLVAGHSQLGFIFETAWANFAINLFMYVLAGHVVGACWYLFGLQRVNECLHNVCKAEKSICNESYLDCGYRTNIELSRNRGIWIKATNASYNCFASPTFEYGIYVTAVPITTNPSLASKYFYSLFWGFLQITTLAGNLVPSLFIWEVFFTMGIIGLGLLLFALLIGNVQNFLQSLGRRQMDMQLRRYDVEVWMKRRNLSQELKRKVRQAERYKWATTRGVNEGELLEGLPEDLHKEIRRELAYAKDVRIFQVMEKDVLDAILERLHQKVYIKKSVIIQPHYTVDRMLFIVRGELVSVNDDGSKDELTGGSFCGEELFIFCLEHHIKSGSGMNMKRGVFSNRTVECVTNVEAFSLEAEDLVFLVNQFNHHLKNPRILGAIRYESPLCKNVAVRCIQAAWRRRMSALRG